MSAFLQSPPTNGVHLGPLFIHAYGLAFVVAALAAVAITVGRWEAKGGQRGLVYEVALWGFPAGLIGGRLYFLATSWNEVPPHWCGPFAVWKGGLGIWGGVAAGTLTGVWILRRRGANIPAFLDAAAPALLVARRSAGSATTSTRSCSATLRRCRGALRSAPRTARSATRNTPPSSPRSSTSCSGTCCSPPRSSGLDATVASAHRACSRYTSPATPSRASARSWCGWTQRITSSGCG